MKKIILSAIIALNTVIAGYAASNLNFGLRADGKCYVSSSPDASGDVVIPATAEIEGVAYPVSIIGPCAFIDNRNIVSLTIPDGIESVDAEAFYGCHNLASVRMEGGDCTFGQDAFRACPALQKVYVPSVEKWLSNVYSNEFSSPTSNYADLYIDGNLLSELSIPECCREIGNYAFKDVRSLQKATIGSHVTRIGDHAFDGDESLETITIADGVQTIGSFAFNICVGLRELTVPNSVTSIGAAMCYRCMSLEQVQLSRAVEEIPELAFCGCEKLKSIDFIHDLVTTIGGLAFYGCQLIETAILPESVKNIGRQAFGACTSLKEAAIPGADAQLDAYLFSNCSSLTSVVLPSGLKEIPSGLLYGCVNLGEIEIPKDVNYIGMGAFAMCYSLKEVELPESLEYIEQEAFYGCRLFRSLRFGANLKSIATYAFYQCPQLERVDCYAVEPPVISFFAFDLHADANCRILVPEVSEALYRETYGWRNFRNLEGSAALNPDTQLTMRLCDGGTMVRAVAYGAEITMRLTTADGKIPAKVLYNGEDITPTVIAGGGSYTTPPITSPVEITLSAD